MDIVDLDEDVFYYFKQSSGSDEYHQYQEEVKRDEVKKGKSFLKMKGAQVIFITDWIVRFIEPDFFLHTITIPSNVLKFSLVTSIFHPPR